MADEDQGKILGFTKKEAEILIMSLQVFKPNQCTTNGCTVGPIPRSCEERHSPTIPLIRGHNTLLELHCSSVKESGAITYKDLTGLTFGPCPYRSLQQRGDGAYSVRCSEG